MNKLILLTSAAILCFGIIYEVKADDSATTAEDTTQTQEAQKLLSDRGKCGNGCLYQITTDSTTGTRNLRVYNAPSYTGVANIANEAFAGKGNNTGGKYKEYHNNAVFDKITIDGDFDTIGEKAFWHNEASEVVFNGNIKNIGYASFEFNNLSSVNLPEGLQSIETEGFHRNPISSVIIPDSVTEVDSYAFGTMQAGSYVYISDTLNSVGGIKTFGSGNIDTISIICKGDVAKCEGLVSNYSRDENKTTESLPVTGVDKDHCTGEKYFWNGTSCSRKETYCDKDMYYSGYECRMRPTDGSEITCDYDISGYVKVGNNCYSPEVTYAKKHYTPAEANQWLKDGNDNFVVLTFKK